MKFCINAGGRKNVNGIPYSSMIFSSPLCIRPIIVPNPEEMAKLVRTVYLPGLEHLQ
jgi:hypothetical protein